MRNHTQLSQSGEQHRTWYSSWMTVCILLFLQIYLEIYEKTFSNLLCFFNRRIWRGLSRQTPGEKWRGNLRGSEADERRSQRSVQFPPGSIHHGSVLTSQRGPAKRSRNKE